MSTSKPTAPPFRVIADGGVTTPLGFRAGAATGGIKQSGKPDVAVLACDGPAQFAAAFTRNAFAAAPVSYSRQVAQRAPHLRACVINSGNANCGTGHQGLLDAQNMAAAAADCLNVNADEVLVFSTGRIGVPLPMAKVTAGIRGACGQLARDQGLAAAAAIMTTDTVRKSLAVAVDIAGTPVHVGGMAKGVGMIAPHLAPAPKQATMLAFVTTDAKFAPGTLEAIFAASLDQSFNRITVDGDTSTNDSFVALASGLADLPAIRPGTVEAERFQQAFNQVAGELAKAMVRDGEGATRFIELRVAGARTPADAEVCAKTIANSLLVKTAWFGGDPNWGRILAAAGRSGAAIEPTETSLYFEGVAVVRGGMPAGTPEAELAKLVDRKELHLELDLGLGNAEYTVWTCDLSYEYVKINAEYRT